MTRTAAVAALALLLTATARGAPEDTGAFSVIKTTVQVPVGGGTQLDTDIYVPQATGPFPTVVMRHGWMRSKAAFANWGNHLASRGFTVLVITSRSPSSPNPDVDSDDQLAVLAWAVQQHTVSGSALEGKVDASRRGITGHSAGGLCATVAASKDPTLRAAVLFDPVDVSGTGVGAAPNIGIPTITMIAEPGTCNFQANGVSIFQAIGGPRYGMKIPGSGHCDPEDPSDHWLCGLPCGGDAQAQYQLLHRRYGTAFLEAFLKCDPAAYPYLNGATALGDTGITIYPETNIVIPPPGCGDSDGGTPQADAAPVDAPGPPDAIDYPDGLPRDAIIHDSDHPPLQDGAGGSDAGTDGGDSGCGCRASGAATLPAALLLVALALVARRRRR